jgi:hypothetical protein
LNKVERKSLDQTKNKAKFAAGISIQGPKASGGVSYGLVDSSGNENGNASLLQPLRLAWEARGSDTLIYTK